MRRPEGYRKAVRLFELAERFSLPVLSFVDTTAAYPGRLVRGARRGRGDRALRPRRR
jgi:acetyl-CoA carboxylase carboxyl transferase subunit alpha